MGWIKNLVNAQRNAELVDELRNQSRDFTNSALDLERRSNIRKLIEAEKETSEEKEKATVLRKRIALLEIELEMESYKLGRLRSRLKQDIDDESE